MPGDAIESGLRTGGGSHRPQRVVRAAAAVLMLMAGSLYLAACAQPVVTDPLDERSVEEVESDLAIRVMLNRLFFRQDIRLYQTVSFAVIEGRVLLTGTVSAADDADRAHRLARRVPGVREVINEIHVADESNIVDYARDALISTEVNAALAADADIVSNNYRVETVDGTLYLVGIAQDEGELELVKAHAGSVDGVERVVSHVIMKDDPRRPAPPDAR